MTKATPLLRFLRALTADQRKLFADSCGTTVGYLYQIAGQPKPNPQLRLALAIRRESLRIGRRAMVPPLTLEDLLVGTDEDTQENSDGS